MFAYMGERISMDKRDLPFFVLAEQHRFADLLAMPYPLPGFSASPSFQPFAPIGLGLPFPNALSWHCFLQPFFLSGIEYSIDDESLVLGSPWF